MWSNVRVLRGVGTCIGLGIGTMYLKIGAIQAESFQELNDRLSSCPYLVWDYDWDKRAPKKKNKAGKLQKLSEILKKITETGKIKWESVYHSTILRSRAQALIIKKALNGDVKLKALSSLVEGVPVEPSPKVSDIPCVSPEIIFQDRPRLESVFLSIFHRADANQKADSNEIIFAHPNVIRYFVCRALQMPPEAFSRFHLFHASISRVKINGNGTVVLEVLGDAGYLPCNLLTSGELEGAPPVLVDPDDRPNEDTVNRLSSIMSAVEGAMKNQQTGSLPQQR